MTKGSYTLYGDSELSFWLTRGDFVRTTSDVPVPPERDPPKPDEDESTSTHALIEALLKLTEGSLVRPWTALPSKAHVRISNSACDALKLTCLRRVALSPPLSPLSALIPLRTTLHPLALSHQSFLALTSPQPLLALGPVARPVVLVSNSRLGGVRPEGLVGCRTREGGPSWHGGGKEGS